MFLCGKFELNTIFLLYCMKLSHINHDEKIYTAVFLNFLLTSRIKGGLYQGNGGIRVNCLKFS